MIIVLVIVFIIGKMVNGIVDNMLIMIYLLMKVFVFVVLVMDLDMFVYFFIWKNLDMFCFYGNYIIELVEGELVSYLVGKGRMEELEKIVEILEVFFVK